MARILVGASLFIVCRIQRSECERIFMGRSVLMIVSAVVALGLIAFCSCSKRASEAQRSCTRCCDRQVWARKRGAGSFGGIRCDPSVGREGVGCVPGRAGRGTARSRAGGGANWGMQWSAAKLEAARPKARARGSIRSSPWLWPVRILPLCGYGSYYNDPVECYVVRRRVMKRYGWRIRRVSVCD